MLTMAAAGFGGNVAVGKNKKMFQQAGRMGVNMFCSIALMELYLAKEQL